MHQGVIETADIVGLDSRAGDQSARISLPHGWWILPAVVIGLVQWAYVLWLLIDLLAG